MRGGWSHRGTVLTKISHNHFSFIKGVYLGLNELEMYRRYIEYPGAKEVDPRTIPSVRKWIIAELIRLAGRYDRKTGIRLLQKPPEELKLSVFANESLEAFADRMGMDISFYSEAELIEVFKEHHADNPELRANAKKCVFVSARSISLPFWLLKSRFSQAPKT